MILLLALAALAGAADPPPVETSLHGDVKTFFVASFPYPFFAAPELPAAPQLTTVPPGFTGMTDFLQGLSDAAWEEQLEQIDPDAYVDPLDDPTGQGTIDFRLKGRLAVGDHWRFDLHHAVSSFNVPLNAGLPGAGSGVALSAPELVDLTWQAETGNALTIRGRTDRLTGMFSVPNLDLTVGRQPVSFGSGLMFTPMDVVNPFSAATIDTEYKPGIDAVRMDGYAGVATRATGVVAWAGAAPIHDPDRQDVTSEDVVLALNGQATIGVTDVQVLVAAVRAEPVFGVGVVSGVGPVGLHGDATLTLPAEDALEDDPFVRAVVGATVRPTATTTLSGELYTQGFGAADPADYWPILTGPRFARSEVWQVGRYYAGVVWGQEITPLVSSSLALIGNLTDPSVLVAPGLSWSVSNEASFAVGAFAGIGRRPDLVPLVLDEQFLPVDPAVEDIASAVNSEFGLYPPAVYAQLKAYF